MSGRLIFTRQTKQDVDNHYVVGAGVGSPSRFARQALRRRASNSQRVDSKGKKVWGPCQGFCAQYPASGAQQRAARAVRAFRQYVEEGDVSVQMPTSITVSAASISGDGGQFSRTTLPASPAGPTQTKYGLDSHYPLVYAMGSGIVGTDLQAGIEIYGAQNSGPLTINSFACDAVGGCSLTYGNTAITVTGGIWLPQNTNNAPSFRGTTVLTFYDATF